jgi:hypothetical protein
VARYDLHLIIDLQLARLLSEFIPPGHYFHGWKEEAEKELAPNSVL